MQKPVVEFRALDTDPFRQNKGSLKLTRGNPAVQVNPCIVFNLPAAHDELAVFQLDRKFVHREPRDRERDAKPVFRGLFDIVWRIAVGLSLLNAVKRTFEMIEPQQ